MQKRTFFNRMKVCHKVGKCTHVEIGSSAKIGHLPLKICKELEDDSYKNGNQFATMQAKRADTFLGK